MTPDLFIALLAAAIQTGTPILYATLGEIIDIMKDEFGIYREENWI